MKPQSITLPPGFREGITHNVDLGAVYERLSPLMINPLEEHDYERTFSNGMRARATVVHYAKAVRLVISFDPPDSMFEQGSVVVHDLREAAHWRVDVLRDELKNLRFEFPGSLTAQLGAFVTIIFRPEEVA